MLKNSGNNYHLKLFVFFWIPTILLLPQDLSEFEHLSTIDGLSIGIVYHILKDRDGYLWFATQDGLNRYDGYNFRIFKNNPNNKNSISNSNVSTLCEKDTWLWVGTWGGGLNKFDKSNHFIHYINNPKDSNSINGDLIQRLYVDSKGTIWIGMQNGLDEFDPGNNRFKHILKNIHVYNFAEDKSGNLFIATINGLYIIDQNRKGIINQGYPAASSSSLISDVKIDHNGIIWVGTLYGLFQFNPETGEFVKINLNGYNDNNVDLDKISVYCLCEDKVFNMWIGTLRQGFYKIDRNKKEVICYSNDPNNFYSISSNDIKFIFQDDLGILWIATNRGGVNKLNLKPRKFELFYHISNNPNSISHNSVLSFFQDKDSILWIGTVNGLNKFKRDKKRFTYIKLEGADRSIRGNVPVNTICRGPDNNLWIGTDIYGLFVYDTRKNLFVDLNSNPLFTGVLKGVYIRKILRGSDGDYWFATQVGLFRYDSKLKRIVRNDITTEEKKLINNNIRTIFEGDDNILWIGTTDAGLIRYNMKNNQYMYFKNNPDDVNSLINNYVLSINENENFVWVGTPVGLNALDKKTFRITRYTEYEGLPNSCINGILKDDKGNLWISTNNGLSKFNPDKKNFRNYDRFDGLQSNEFNYNSCLKTMYGEMFFGGINGFNSFFPYNVKDNEMAPPIVITSFKVNDVEKDFNKSIPQVKEIILNPNEENFSFEFAALDYTSSGKNMYKYMLDGFDNDWIACGNRKYASYTNIDGGTYYFKVIGSNSDGYWNNEGVSIKLIIVPPFWQTFWFKISSVFIIMLSGFVIYRGRVRSIEKRRAQVEGLNERLLLENKERKQAEAEMRKAKEEAEKSDKLKSEFLAQISHEIRTPINTILSFSNLLKDELEDQIPEDLKQSFSIINGAGNRLIRTIDLILNMSQLQTNTYEFNYKQFDIYSEILVGLLHQHKRIAAEKNLELLLKKETENTTIYADEYTVGQIFENLLNNAIKYTKQGKVGLKISRDENNLLEVEVSDTGIGISEKFFPNLFKPFTQEEGGYTRRFEGNGLGLALVKKYVELNGASIQVRSRKGEGTKFRVVFKNILEQT